MKRPFAVIGFSMLMTFLIITNIAYKTTIALLIGVIVVFCSFIIIQYLRKYKAVIFSLLGVILLIVSFLTAQDYYIDEMLDIEKPQTLNGVVCQTPSDSDYAFTYIIKVQGKNYKIRFVSQDDKFIKEGDCVTVAIAKHESIAETEFLKSSLSSKTYFTFFESDNCTIEMTGESNFYYKNVGAVKRAFSDIIMKYLPGKNGAIARAMTIGDKSEIDSHIVDCFNYCGTSHLLVISGLHLTIWSLGTIKLLNKSSRLRKYAPVVGLVCLFLYSSITGFSVSVLRAGAMVGSVLVGKLFRRDADSINSIGVAVTFILLFNPFAPFSVSLWFSVLSTLGILAYSDKVWLWIEEKARDKFKSRLPFFAVVATTIAISFSTTVFTIPVFIFNFKIIPIASILSNIIMVDVAMMLMILTVVGVLSHLLFLYPVARACFLITGALGEFLHIFAEKIGMATWSTISINHHYYKYFLVLMLVGVGIFFFARKYKVDILKPVTVTLSVIFISTAIYCTAYDHNTPSVEMSFTDSNPVIVVNSKGKSVLVGTQDKKNIDTVKELLNRHNKKQIDALVVTENEGKTVSRIINLCNNFDITGIYFRGEALQLFSNHLKSNVTGFNIGGNINVNIKKTECIDITSNGKRLLIVNSENAENLFENAKECDIIILYGDKAFEYEKRLSSILTNSQVIAATERKTVSVYFP